MMMSGSGASTCAAACGRAATSRLTEVTTTTVPAGHRQPGGPGQELAEIRSGRLRLAPVERCAIDPDAVEDHGDLPGDGDLCLLHADPLRELHSPGLEGRPFFCSIKKDGRGLEQVSSEKPVAPSRYLATGVSFAGLVAPRRKAEVGADGRGRSEARGIIDRVAERQGPSRRRLPEPSSGGASFRPTLPTRGPRRRTCSVAGRRCSWIDKSGDITLRS